MTLLGLISLLVSSFGALAYGAMLLLWVAAVRRRRPRGVDLVNGVMTFVCVVWFVVCVLRELDPLYGDLPRWTVRSLHLLLASLFPPLIMHLFYLETSQATGAAPPARPGPLWRLPIVATYVVGPPAQGT